MWHQFPAEGNGSRQTHADNVLRGIQRQARGEDTHRNNGTPAKWNPGKERPIGGLKGLESAEANAMVEKLATVRATVESEYRNYVNKFQSYPDKAIFKEQVIGLLAGTTTVKASDPSQSLISFFDRQVKLSPEGKRTVLKGKRAGMRYRENTIRSYEGSRTLLQEYV